MLKLYKKIHFNLLTYEAYFIVFLMFALFLLGLAPGNISLDAISYTEQIINNSYSCNPLYNETHFYRQILCHLYLVFKSHILLQILPILFYFLTGWVWIKSLSIISKKTWIPILFFFFFFFHPYNSLKITYTERDILVGLLCFLSTAIQLQFFKNKNSKLYFLVIILTSLTSYLRTEFIIYALLSAIIMGFHSKFKILKTILISVIMISLGLFINSRPGEGNNSKWLAISIMAQSIHYTISNNKDVHYNNRDKANIESILPISFFKNSLEKDSILKDRVIFGRSLVLKHASDPNPSWHKVLLFYQSGIKIISQHPLDYLNLKLSLYKKGFKANFLHLYNMEDHINNQVISAKSIGINTISNKWAIELVRKIDILLIKFRLDHFLSNTSTIIISFIGLFILGIFKKWTLFFVNLILLVQLAIMIIGATDPQAKYIFFYLIHFPYFVINILMVMKTRAT